ncbi:hypothetical protein TMES_00920 [Thalassospira mesophila]|uniref:Uncharacterized protein n=1 Tax=Thalassospira mesophila TaxID=1293891 RepID=A0A1Y2L3K9_9PROT|nr:hypothetical protein TMES_00920 [Thalassospira mesophila]
MPDISNPDVNITAAPIIFQDDIPGLEDLTREVGPDIVTLAVLSDVPLHRPRRLELEDLVGQWRWLRQVWAFFDTPDTNLIGANFGTAAINNAHYNADDKPDLTLEISQITDAIVACRLHIAIASLRSLFQKIKQQPADVENQAQISFLILLCLFCPYIGHELLYRYGIVEIPEQPES